ncbi:MAG: hypothetical protein MJ171_01265 [Clostridia bacterium]|nr:hypothetical protein [Clostridia bacterium]
MDTLTVVIICIAVFIIQMLLCFLGKKLFIKLIPALLFAASFVIFLILTVTASGWDSLAYIVFVMLSAIFLIPCAIAWAIWLIKIYIDKRNKEKVMLTQLDAS